MTFLIKTEDFHNCSDWYMYKLSIRMANTSLYINPADGGGGCSKPPVLHLCVLRVNETKSNLSILWVFLKYCLENFVLIFFENHKYRAVWLFSVVKIYLFMLDFCQLSRENTQICLDIPTFELQLFKNGDR